MSFIRKHRLIAFVFALSFLTAQYGEAQELYKQPPKRIVEIVDTPPTPFISINPRGGSFLLQEFVSLVDLKTLAQPLLRLAGIRFFPKTATVQYFAYVTNITVKDIKTGAEVKLKLPPKVKAGRGRWSYDGKKIAVRIYEDKGTSIWVFDPKTGEGKAIMPPDLHSILVPMVVWGRDSDTLFISRIPENRGQEPQPPEVPTGPNIEEAAGKVSKLRTFQDLIKTAYDEELFAWHARSQIYVYRLSTGEMRKLGQPDFYRSMSLSPDGSLLLVDRIKQPFSHTVTWYYFSHTTEVWDMSGNKIKEITSRPAAEDLPIEGVPTGPREIHWQPLLPATLFWTEALDDGDPNKVVPLREKIMAWNAPFKDEPFELFKIPQRLYDFIWLGEKGKILITDWDRDRKWVTTRLFDTFKPQTASQAKVIFDRSENDDYGNPGYPVYVDLPDGQSVVPVDKEWIYLDGDGATPQGVLPFLRRFRLSDGASTTVFLCASGTYEKFAGFTDDQRSGIITSFESPTQNPNYYLRPLESFEAGPGKPVTQFPNPAPELSKIRKELVTYKRKDGVPLSGTLYYPFDYEPGKKYPTVIWAYPLEYADASMAGQVRSFDYQFPRLEASSVLFFLLHGYAVLYDAEIPIVGPPMIANDTYVEQLIADAQATVDMLVAKGISDRHRIGVTGHSYGANMTANLLAQTDLFAAGIARSGAYNRTLTPFGFQGERRTFWEIPEMYLKLSPFTHAHKIKNPLLLIHGELDENAGTFPMQSERLIAAIRGAGGRARLVKLPYEGHGYRSRESVLHVLAEMFEWFDLYVKNNKTATPSSALKSPTQ